MSVSATIHKSTTMHADVTWTSLSMSLLPFWALYVVALLLLVAVEKLSDFIKNILICVLKMNEGLTDLEQHEGE